VLGEKGNTLLVDVDPCEEMLNAQPSAEEEWLWAQMSTGDCQSKLPPMMEGTAMPRYESDPESQGTEDGEEDGAEELETQLPSITIPSMLNKRPLQGNKV